MAHDLDLLRSIPEIARMRDMKPRTLRRLLTQVNDRLKEDGKDEILKNPSGRKRGKRLTTLRAVREALGGTYTEERASREEVERLRQDLTDTNKKLNALAAAFRQKSHEWFIAKKR